MVKFMNNPATGSLYALAFEANGVKVYYRPLDTTGNRDSVEFRVRVEADDIGITDPDDSIPARWEALGFERGATGERRHASQVVYGQESLQDLLSRTIVVADEDSSVISIFND